MLAYSLIVIDLKISARGIGKSFRRFRKSAIAMGELLVFEIGV
jgi:hypothetical protein